MTEVRTREYLASEVAVLASLVLHALAFLAWAQSDKLARFVLFKPLVKALTASTWTPPAPAETPVPTITFVEEPKTFIETDASQFTGEEPKSAKLYSTLPSVAANPENPTGKVGDTPYLEGKETRVMSTESVRPAAPSLPASPPAPPPAPPAPPQPKVEEPPPKIADEGLKVAEETKVVMAEPPPSPPPQAPAPPPAAPPSGSSREIAAIKSRLTAAGAGRIGIAAFNVVGSPFGEYDKILIRAVQSRWYAYIQQFGLYERAGSVTLHFNLLSDGSVKNMEIRENSAGLILGSFCEKAVIDSAPFAPLPEQLKVLIGNEAREVNFTFYY